MINQLIQLYLDMPANYLLIIPAIVVAGVCFVPSRTAS